MSSNAITIDPRRAALAADPFEPQTMPELYKFAETVCRTAFCPKDFQGKPDDCFVAMLHGKSLGLAALASIQGVGVINGRPNTWGETFWAVVISHPEFQDVEESVDDNGAVCIITRRGKTPKKGEFTRKDAEVAGLLGKDNYKKDPKIMFLWRARHRAASIFADALKGILPREVAQDFIDGEVVTPRVQPLAFAEVTAGTKQEKAAPKGTVASSTPATSNDVKKQEPAAEAKPDTITPAQGKEWNDARKASGHTTAEATAYLADVHKVQRTGDMLVSRFDEAMTWAKTPKSKEEPKAEEAKPIQEPQSGDQKFCLRTWDALGTDQEERAEHAQMYTDVNGVIDWENLGTMLHSQLEARNQ